MRWPRRKSGQPVLIEPGQSSRVGAIQKLRSFEDTYLFVTRAIDPNVQRQLQLTEDGVKRYSELDHLRRGIKIASAIIYVVIALTLLLAAIWLGLWFANRLVSPIRRLIGAAQLVSQGNLNVQVPVRRGESDLKVLSTTFNRMTSELKNQRDELVSANSQMQERRRFIEAVLSGVTAGVIGLDRDGTVNLANPSAERLLGRSAGDLVGRRLEDVVPEFAALPADDGTRRRGRRHAPGECARARLRVGAGPRHGPRRRHGTHVCRAPDHGSRCRHRTMIPMAP